VDAKGNVTAINKAVDSQMGQVNFSVVRHHSGRSDQGRCIEQTFCVTLQESQRQMQSVGGGRFRQFVKSWIGPFQRMRQRVISAVKGVTAQHTLRKHDEISSRGACLFKPSQNLLKIGIDIGERNIGLDAG
jgi:hypothetical protein